MDFNLLVQRYLIILLTVFVISCGGGGGDEGGNINPLPAPVVPPSPTYSLKITEDNASVIGYGLVYAESILQFSDSALSIFLDYYGNTSSTISCKEEDSSSEQGTVSIAHDDVNNNFTIDAGEIVTIEYASCFDKILDDDVTGSVELEIIELLVDEDNGIAIEANFSTQNFQLYSMDEGTSGQVSASFKVKFNLTDDEIIMVESDDDGFFYLTQEGLSESAKNFQLSKTTYFERSSSKHENDMSFQIDFESTGLGGTFRCEAALIHFETNFPTSSDAKCYGDNSTVKISNDIVSLDDSGENSYEVLGQINWWEVFEGYIYSDANRIGGNQRLAFNLKVGRKALSTRQVFEDKANNRLLIFTTVLDSKFPNSLVAMDINSNEIYELINFNSAKLKSLVFSYDASQYCSILEESDVFTCYNLSNNTEIYSLNVDHGYESGDPSFDEAKVFICDAVAANLVNGYYALRLGKQNYRDCTNIVLVQSGQQLPISFKSIPSNDSSKIGGLQDSIVFAPDDKSIFLDGKGYTVIDLFLLPINGDGFAELLNISLSSDSSHDLSIVDGSLFDWRSMYDPISFTKLGKYERKDRSGWSNHYAAKYFDVDENKAYFFDEDGEIVTYFYKEYLPIAEFSLGISNESKVMAMNATDSHLLVLTNTEIFTIPKTELDVQEKYNQTCDLSMADDDYWGSMDCKFSNAIYDSSRNRVYGTLESAFGVNGNSVVIFDLGSKETIEHVYVGSEPTSMNLSGNKEKLYVGFDDTDRIIEIDLETLLVKDALLLVAKNVTPDFLNFDTDLVVGQISFTASSPFSADEFIVGVDEGFIGSAAYLSLYHSEESQITESSVDGAEAKKIIFSEKNQLIGMSTYGGIEEFGITSGVIEALDTKYYSPSSYGSPIFDQLTISNDKLIYDVYGNVFNMVNGESTKPFNLDGGQFGYSSLILDEDDDHIYFVSHDLHVSDGVSISKYSLITDEWLGGFNEDVSKKSRKGGVSFITSDRIIGATDTEGRLFFISGSSLE